MKKREGLHQLTYKKGFEIEAEKFKEYEKLITLVLNASEVEQVTRGLVDKVTGCDAYAQIDGYIYGVSLRCRAKDYNSFTLSRHYTDQFSEVHKWTTDTTDNKIKPLYHVQINERGNDEVRVIKVNIEAFSLHLQYLIENNKLEDYYNSTLKAYEFRLSEEKDTIENQIINKKQI